MASPVKVNEEVDPVKVDFADLLTCTICLETFKQPKYLPCLHTFCEICINTYIVSTVKDEHLKEFKCPVCRRLVPLGDNMEKPDKWARNLPGNHFVVSMIDRRSMRKAEKLCDACSRKNVSQRAITWCTVCEEAYCDTCEANHKTFKVTLNHKIVPIKDINEDTPISNICASVACDEHPDKLIEIYCKDHTQPCCTICATVHHRKCEHVVTIDKAVCGVKDSTNAQKLTKKLIETSYKLEEIIQNRNLNKTNFENEMDVALAEIANMRKKLNEKLDQQENKMREEVNSARKVNVLRLSEEYTELSALKSTIDHWKNLFEACLSQGSDIQCLVKMEEIYKKIPQLENDLSKVVQGIKDISVKFEATDISTVGFGRLHSTEKRPSLLGLKTVNFQTGKIKVLFTIDIKGNFISGIFFNDDIIIIDYDKKMVVYHDNTGKQTGVLSVRNNPIDITKMNDQTVAVSSYARKIFIIDVKPLTLVKTLDVSVPMWGLCLVEDEYITGNNIIISWLNADTGAKIKQISTGTGSDTRYVTCYRKSEYIYCGGQHTVKFESALGKSFQYNDSKLSYSYNQEIDEEGNIYVVGYSSNNIHQLTPTGQLIRIIPVSDINSTVTRPWVMRFKRNTNRFLLTFHTSAGPVLVCEIE